MTMADYATVRTTPSVALLSRHCQPPFQAWRAFKAWNRRETTENDGDLPETDKKVYVRGRRFLIGTTSFIARAADDNGDDGDEDDDEDEDEDRSRDSTVALLWPVEKGRENPFRKASPR
ncbi:hypothetical protein K0M31_014237 [Melipona bicolor]|uniref:Uncharacterized protein n=1 Tax=Melipona bicolor TaxID=60889 RepID=A0AA40KU61_9HYME|nr:hypothetical protein K0M31_014237 [Melipona bicolor]